MPRIFYGTVGNPRRGFPDEKDRYFYIKDGLDRHGGAAQTAPFFGVLFRQRGVPFRRKHKP